MTAAATVTTATHQKAPPPPRRGRPPKPEPNPTLAIPADVDFWDWLSGFSTDEWTSRIAYLWRTGPIFDIGRGQPTAIKKYASRFDLDTIIQEEGSGGYRLDVCYKDPASGAQQRIAQHFWVMVDKAKPPRLPIGPWTTDPRNQDWKWCVPMLEAEAAEAEASAEVAIQVAQDPNRMFTTVLEGVRTLRGEAGDNQQLASAVVQMVSANQNAMIALSDPTKQLATIQAMLALLKPQGSSEGNLVIEILREELRSTRTELSQLRAEMAKPKSLLEQVNEIVPVIKEVAGTLGFRMTTGRGEGTDWGSVVEKTIDRLSDHVPLIVSAIERRPHTPAPGGGVWTSGGGASLVEKKNPPSEGSSSEAQPPATPAGMTADEVKTEQDRIKAAFERYAGLLQAIYPFLLDYYKRGMSGYDLQEWIIEAHGRLNYAALKDEIGAEALSAAAMAHPHLKTALAPAERLFQFLTEVFTERPDDGAPESVAEVLQ